MQLFPSIALALFTAMMSLSAQTVPTAVNTIPEGTVTFSLPQTVAAQSITSYWSVPIINDPVYTGVVASLSTVLGNPNVTTTNTISVSDSPAPWTAGQLTNPATPYFVKFLSGAEAGRVIQVFENAASTLTLDTTDGLGASPVALDTAGFQVAAGDSFEVFAAYTLGSLFGTTPANLVLIGGPIFRVRDWSASKYSGLHHFYPRPHC